MDKKQVTITVAKQKKHLMSQLSASGINVTDLQDFFNTNENVRKLFRP